MNQTFQFCKREVLIIIFLITSIIYSEDMWKISTSGGQNLSCTKLIGISNDSLQTEMLGKRRSFAIDNINKITSFNKNVNLYMIIGAGSGVLGGLVIGDKASINESDKPNNSGIISAIMGLIAGTLSAHLLSVNSSIDLSSMEYIKKKQIILKLIN